MRIGLFSDVHGNLTALEAVLEAYASMNIDRYICLGDVVGYGPWPNECCDRVRPLVDFCIVGNHDAAVSGRMDYNYYYDAARTVLDYHASLLSPENMAWLESLPYQRTEDGICFSHGSPVNPDAFDYVFNPVQAAGLLEHWDELAPITVMGHSHLTKSFALRKRSGIDAVEELKPPRMRFEDDARYIITVGSVGQPRDNDARACFTVLDTDERSLEFHRVDYDIAAVAARIFDDSKLTPDFGKRLFLGI